MNGNTPRRQVILDAIRYAPPGIAADAAEEFARFEMRVAQLEAALVEASEALDNSGCQIAASQAHQAVVGRVSV